MRKLLTFFMAGLMLMSACSPAARAGEMEVLVSKLVEKGILTPNEGQLIMTEAKQEVAKELAIGQASTAPEWTQKIKVKGDVRMRTQTDWGKDLGRANSRVRQRMRARVGVDGKLNEQLSGGVRIASGNDNKANSTNQTLEDDFSKKPVWIDQMYMLWSPKMDPRIGDAKIWGGKFTNPLVTTEVMWDNDINPEGMAVQYNSPTFLEETVPTNLFFNGGMFWIDEASGWEADPLMWVGQAGFTSMVYDEWESQFTGALAYYNLTNTLQKDGIPFRSWTNTGWQFQDVDLILMLDNKRFMGLEVPWGLYTDYVVNVASSNQDAYLLGAYLGYKSPKNAGEWKMWTEWRLLDINSVFDALPDSDFFGFKLNGTPVEGGTNAKGINLGVQYALWKDAVLNLEYYYSTPIEVQYSGAYEDSPRQLLQVDMNIKF